jgi:hypothetical protein
MVSGIATFEGVEASTAPAVGSPGVFPSPVRADHAALPLSFAGNDYELCPRCALVVTSGQVNIHLVTCSGVT